MSEQGAESLDNPTSSPPLPPSLKQAGALLRAAREAQGMHIAALAVSLKVPVKKLEALEAGQLEQLPDLVFVRALALSICRSLKVDPAAIMASLPEPQASPFKAIETNLNTTFKEDTPSSHAPLSAQLTSPLGIAVLLIVAVIVAILAWPSDWRSDMAAAPGTSTQAVPVPEPAQPADLTVSTPTNAPSAAPQGLLAEPATPVPAPAGVAEPLAPSQPSQPAPPDAAAAVAQQPLPASAPMDSQAQAAPLVLSASGESWVEVVDSAGQTRLRKLAVAGEVLRVSGSLPLSVKIGRADQVAVSVHGQPLDLLPLARNNVASFEVK